MQKLKPLPDFKGATYDDALGYCISAMTAYYQCAVNHNGLIDYVAIIAKPTK